MFIKTWRLMYAWAQLHTLLYLVFSLSCTEWLSYRCFLSHMTFCSFISRRPLVMENTHWRTWIIRAKGLSPTTKSADQILHVLYILIYINVKKHILFFQMPWLNNYFCTCSRLIPPPPPCWPPVLSAAVCTPSDWPLLGPGGPPASALPPPSSPWGSGFALPPSPLASPFPKSLCLVRPSSSTQL